MFIGRAKQRLRARRGFSPERRSAATFGAPDSFICERDNSTNKRIKPEPFPDTVEL
jgi:hypothetical protein